MMNQKEALPKRYQVEDFGEMAYNDVLQIIHADEISKLDALELRGAISFYLNGLISGPAKWRILIRVA
jgi:hypothetical protein